MKKKLLRATALFFAVLFLLSSLCGCGKQGKTLLTLRKDGKKYTFSVNLYELMLSRMKGSLCYYGYELGGNKPTDDAFWSYTDVFDGKTQTLDEYYCASILDNCKTYLAAEYLFDANGLALSDANNEEVRVQLDELLRADGDGSKTKLNAVLADYGVNYDILKTAYETEQKISVLREHLYGKDASLIGDNLKTQFMEENYVHFKQVFLASYSFVYETDKNGDVIYYLTESESKNRIAYDKNGIAAEETDKNGDTVYYNRSKTDPAVSDGTIAYDKANGTPSRKVNEKTGAYETAALTAEELAALATRAEELLTSLSSGDDAAFEAAITDESDESDDASTYTDGYYLKRMDYEASGADYAYLAEIVEKLDTMQPGEVAMVKSGFGYHIVRKYDYTEKAYALEANATWFETFADDLIESLFLELCRSLYDDITVDEGVLADARTMKNVKPNYYY